MYRFRGSSVVRTVFPAFSDSAGPEFGGNREIREIRRIEIGPSSAFSLFTVSTVLGPPGISEKQEIGELGFFRDASPCISAPLSVPTESAGLECDENPEICEVREILGGLPGIPTLFRSAPKSGGRTLVLSAQSAKSDKSVISAIDRPALSRASGFRPNWGRPYVTQNVNSVRTLD